MKFKTTEDIEAPIEHVFTEASDFETFERRALRERVSVTRGQTGPIAPGASWDIIAPFRGRDRHFRAVLTSFDAPDGYIVTTEADGLIFVTTFDLVALSPKRTRITMAIDISARTLTARLLLQSLKLVKTRISEKFTSRMQGYAAGIAESYRSAG